MKKRRIVALETELYDVLGVPSNATEGTMWHTTRYARSNPKPLLRRDQEGVSQEGPYLRPLFFSREIHSPSSL
jgi:hypothetical protein